MNSLKEEFSGFHGLIDGRWVSIGALLAGTAVLGLLDLLLLNVLISTMTSVLSAESDFRSHFLGIVGMDSLSLSTVVTLLGIIILTRLAANVAIQYVILKFCNSIEFSIRSRILTGIADCSLERISSFSPSQYVQAVHGFSGQFAYGLIGQGIKAFGELVTAIYFIVALAIVSGGSFIGLLVFSGVVLIIIYIKTLKPYTNSFAEQTVCLGAELIQSTNNLCSGIREVKVYGVGDRIVGKLEYLIRSYGVNNIRYQLSLFFPRYVVESIFLLVLVAYLLISATDPGNRSHTGMIESAGFLVATIFRVAPAFNFLSGAITQFRFLYPTVCQLNKIIFHLRFRQRMVANISLNCGPGSIEKIELRNVSYSYSGGSAYILRNISMVLKTGAHVGIIGSSGAGKTTLVELILGLREPSAGQFLYYDTAHKVMDREAVVQDIAYVPQNDFIIDGSILENIVFFDKRPLDNKKLQLAVEVSCLSALIEKVPDGLGHALKNGGTNLSGGQRQRIAIARAIYSGRRVLVLDEATNSIDKETEEAILSSINKASKSMIIINISHNPSALMLCDELYCLENGAISRR